MPRTPRRIHRRTLLADLGRVTLGAVVLGGVGAGCASGDTTSDATSGPGAGAPWQRASFGFVSAYVLVRDGEALVFDTGTGDGLTPLSEALGAAGVTWGDVSTVVVSHAHPDHVGGLELVLAEAPEATVHAAVRSSTGSPSVGPAARASSCHRRSSPRTPRQRPRRVAGSPS